MVRAGGALTGVSKRFSRRGPWVLKEIELELPAGSRTVIVGGNGSGKSTLLRIGAGVCSPSKGSVTMTTRVAYVPEKLAPRTRLTGTDYLAHMGRIKGLDPAAIKSRSKDLFDRLDLQPGPGVAIDSLSKGNRQKVVVAQAFLGPVGLLVLDEPFTGLDPSAHRALDELTREAQAGGTAVLMSAHRPMSEKPGLRQLRIDGGSLGEIERDDATTLRYTYEMMVELAPTLRAHDHGQVTSIPGVASGLLRQPDNILVLRTSDAQIDHVLTAAIALGWSVRSVTPRNPIGRSW